MGGGGAVLADKGLGIWCYPCFHPGPFFEFSKNELYKVTILRVGVGGGRFLHFCCTAATTVILDEKLIECLDNNFW